MQRVPPDDCAARLSAADLFGRRVESCDGCCLGTIDSIIHGETATRAVVLTGGNPRAIFVSLDRAIVRDGVVVAIDLSQPGRTDGSDREAGVIRFRAQPQKEL